MKTTKDKIIATSVRLFNERGFVNVSLRDIARELEISPGNLSYHYKNKDVIVAHIYDNIVAERNTLLSGVQLIPSIANINKQLVPLMDLYKKYRFFYLDIIEIIRGYPAIAEKHRIHIQNQIDYIKAMLDYSVGSGNMEREPIEGFYQALAQNVWMVLTFWMNQQIVRGVDGEFHKEARRAMWTMVFPHLTEKGLANFQKARKVSAPQS